MLLLGVSLVSAWLNLNPVVPDEVFRLMRVRLPTPEITPRKTSGAVCDPTPMLIDVSEAMFTVPVGPLLAVANLPLLKLRAPFPATPLPLRIKMLVVLATPFNLLVMVRRATLDTVMVLLEIVVGMVALMISSPCLTMVRPV